MYLNTTTHIIGPHPKSTDKVVKMTLFTLISIWCCCFECPHWPKVTETAKKKVKLRCESYCINRTD